MVTAALYGNSLALTTIAASVEANPDVRLLRVDATEEGARRLQAAHAEVVLFDVATAHPDVVRLCIDQPRVLLIGVDLLAHKALVFGGRSSRAVTLEDLMSVITNQVAASEHCVPERLSDPEPDLRENA
jgi:hypothetical protein